MIGICLIIQIKLHKCTHFQMISHRKDSIVGGTNRNRQITLTSVWYSSIGKGKTMKLPLSDYANLHLIIVLN